LGTRPSYLNGSTPSGTFQKKCPGYQRLLAPAYRLSLARSAGCIYLETKFFEKTAFKKLKSSNINTIRNFRAQTIHHCFTFFWHFNALAIKQSFYQMLFFVGVQII
jgi:hypothetical protein